MRLLPRHNTIRSAEHDDILTCVSDAAFLFDHHIVTRDYMSLKLWDTRHAQEPCASVDLMPSLGARVQELYESDAIFDRFSVIPAGAHFSVFTGLYDGMVAMWAPASKGDKEITYFRVSEEELTEASVNPKHAENALQNGLSDLQRSRRVSQIAVDPHGERFCFSVREDAFLFAREHQNFLVADPSL
jgi:hypothetical protein